MSSGPTAGRTVYVGGITGELENERQLKGVFREFGRVAAVSLRTRHEEGKLSWALVTFDDPEAVEEVLSVAKQLKDERGLLVQELDMAKALASTGQMATIIQEHTWFQPPPREEENVLVVDFRLLSIKVAKVSTVNSESKIKLALVFYWTDSRLANHPEYSNGQPLPPQLWGPKVMLLNAFGTPDVTQTGFGLENPSTGRLKRQLMFEASVDNPMDLRHFPFDMDAIEVCSTPPSLGRAANCAES
eukprot:COSAG04_NODE_298_length_17490_cov_10.214249_6_plen_245_part_00